MSRRLRVFEHRDLHIKAETVQPGDICGFAGAGGWWYEVPLWCGWSYPVARWVTTQRPLLLSHWLPKASRGICGHWSSDLELFLYFNTTRIRCTMNILYQRSFSVLLKRIVLVAVNPRWPLWPDPGLLRPHGPGSVQTHAQHCGVPEWETRGPSALLPEQGGRSRGRVGQTGVNSNSSHRYRSFTWRKSHYLKSSSCWSVLKAAVKCLLIVQLLLCVWYRTQKLMDTPFHKNVVLLNRITQFSRSENSPWHISLSFCDRLSQRVMMQIVQELCKRPGLNKCGFDMPTIYIPNPNKVRVPLLLSSPWLNTL